MVSVVKIFFQWYFLSQNRNPLILHWLQSCIHFFLHFPLGPPKGSEQDALIAKERKVNKVYDSVFSKACELGREQELFDLTKKKKEFYETTEAYHRAMDESLILGDEANIVPEDFL